MFYSHFGIFETNITLIVSVNLYFMVAEVDSIQVLIQKMIREIMIPSVLLESTIKLYIGLLLIELIMHVDKVQHKEENASLQFYWLNL